MSDVIYLPILCRRLKAGENLTKAHRRHLYQLLTNEFEMPHWEISTAYGLLQLLIAISILLLKNMGLITVISVLVFYTCSFTIFSFVLRKKLNRFV